MIRRRDLEDFVQGRHVLNARRHRDGDQKRAKRRRSAPSVCSTPGGIETVISLDGWMNDLTGFGCSTPGGIETVIRSGLEVVTIRAAGAQRPEASRR